MNSCHFTLCENYLIKAYYIRQFCIIHSLEGCYILLDGWWPWGMWSSCSKTCESGVQYRYRICWLDDANNCDGDAQQMQNCNEFACDGKRLAILYMSHLSACSHN